MVPVLCWAVHLAIVVPWLTRLYGDTQFIVAGTFFVIAGSAMIICLIVSVCLFIAHQSRRYLLPTVLNLSWIYYLKVLVYGPTFGTF
jgi:hypothetical protein